MKTMRLLRVEKLSVQKYIAEVSKTQGEVSYFSSRIGLCCAAVGELRIEYSGRGLMVVNMIRESS